MDSFPHVYTAEASGAPGGDVLLGSEGLLHFTSGSPRQFGGRGDLWSPETLICAAVSGCLILTFRAIARASGYQWSAASCLTEGTLDRNGSAVRFTQMHSRVRVTIPASADPELGRRLVEKAERDCLIANSLSSRRTIDVSMEFA